MDFTCQVSFYDEIHSTIVKEHQLLMHKKNKTEYLFSRIQDTYLNTFTVKK